MNQSLSFHGREKELGQLRQLYAERRHAIIIGPTGIGKTAILRRVRETCPLLLCEETSSLRRICDCLERELGWQHSKMNVIERKNRLIEYLWHRGQSVAFDHLALTPPKVARFIGHLAARIPVWIGCRSTFPGDIGHVWQFLAGFVRIELPPLAADETRVLVEAAAATGSIQADAGARAGELHRISKGNPRVLEEMLTELSAREYKMETAFGLDLLDLDRRIQELAGVTNGLESA